MATKKKTRRTSKRKKRAAKHAPKADRFPPGHDGSPPRYLSDSDMRLPTLARWVRMDFRDNPDVLPFRASVAALEPRMLKEIQDPKTPIDTLKTCADIMGPFQDRAVRIIERQYAHLDMQVEQGVQTRAVDLHIEAERPPDRKQGPATPEAVAAEQAADLERLRALPPEERERLGGE